jgi:hypothetical protein
MNRIQPHLLNIFTGIEMDTGEDEDAIECDVDARGEIVDIFQDCCVKRVLGTVDADMSTASLKAVDLRAWD